MDTGAETDVEALAEGYASVVPVKFDLTDHAIKEKISNEWSDIL